MKRDKLKEKEGRFSGTAKMSVPDIPMKSHGAENGCLLQAPSNLLVVLLELP